MPARDAAGLLRHATGRTRSRAAAAGGNQAFATIVAKMPGARRSALPRTPRAQLATLVAAAPDGPEWLHEIKFDGFRILARLERGAARLLSRNGKDWTDRFPEVAAAVARLPAREAVLDGEVAALLPSGITSFQALQNVSAGEEKATVVYYVFDLLFAEGHDVTPVPLETRKEAVRRLIGSAGAPLRYSEHVVGSGPAVHADACRRSLEGIISKRRDAPYEATRTRTWLKVKCAQAQEVVIGGYTDPEGARTGLGALLIGVYERGHLRYAGKVGTGFTTATLRALRRRLGPLAQRESPFADRVPGVRRVHWVRPELVAEVAFTEWTGDGKLRHPSFKGLREDKKPTEVVRERPIPTAGGDGPKT
jgi:bifunctional non-homologous end joining protein LigD